MPPHAADYDQAEDIIETRARAHDAAHHGRHALFDHLHRRLEIKHVVRLHMIESLEGVNHKDRVEQFVRIESEYALSGMRNAEGR